MFVFKGTAVLRKTTRGSLSKLSDVNLVSRIYFGRSGHRKYSLGRPDQQDLSENLAAAQGLACMIGDAHRLFQVGGALKSNSETCESEVTLRQ